MAAAAIPAAIIGSSLIGAKTSKDIAKQGRTPTPQEQEAFQGATGVAGRLGDIGSSLYGRGFEQIGQAGDYYSTLLRGDRAAMTAAVAPAAENISDLYGGFGRALEQRDVRGGSRDLALAEAERDKVGQIARLTAGVQPGAAAALGDLGRFSTATGVGATQAEGGIYSSLLGPALGGRQTGLQGTLAGTQVGANYGQAIGDLIFRLLVSGGLGGGGGGGGYQGAPIGTASTVPG